MANAGRLSAVESLMVIMIILTTGVAWDNAKLSELNAQMTYAPLHRYSLLACVRYGGLWKNLHKADKLPDSLHEGETGADSLDNLEAHHANK